MPLLEAIRQRRVRARAEQHAQFARQIAHHPVSLYQAAHFTGGSPTEVAVWLLLERGYVHVARDGRARGVSGVLSWDMDDPAQSAVFRCLMRSRDGLKLHELISDRECARECEYIQVLDPGQMFPHAKPRAAAEFLHAHCSALLDARFAGLGYHDERAALQLFRYRAPVYQAPGAADTYRVPSRRRRSSSGSSGSCSSESSCSGGSCGSSCGGGCGGS